MIQRRELAPLVGVLAHGICKLRRDARRHRAAARESLADDFL